MAKKKSRKIVSKVKKEEIATIFDCPFCNNKRVIEVKISKKDFKAQINCRICKCNYNTKANGLTEPIDVYSEWIDECEKINK